MPLVKPQPPRETIRAFRDGLAEMILLGRAPRDLGRTVDPQHIYVLAVSDLAKGAGLERAQPTVWEFLVASAAGTVVAACVAHPPEGKRPRMTSLTRGPNPAEALQAVRAVERLPQVRARDFELRWLRISGLSIGAFWLRSPNGGRDLAVPYHTIHHQLERMRAYPMSEFLRVVRGLARRRLQFDDAPRVRKE